MLQVPWQLTPISTPADALSLSQCPHPPNVPTQIQSRKSAATHPLVQMYRVFSRNDISNGRSLLLAGRPLRLGLRVVFHHFGGLSHESTQYLQRECIGEGTLRWNKVVGGVSEECGRIERFLDLRCGRPQFGKAEHLKCGLYSNRKKMPRFRDRH